jgi:transposase
MRYELSDNEWSAIKPTLPNKPRGVPRVNGRRVLNVVFWVLRSGAPRRDLPINSSVHHLLQPLRSPAAGWRVEPRRAQGVHTAEDYVVVKTRVQSFILAIVTAINASLVLSDIFRWARVPEIVVAAVAIVSAGMLAIGVAVTAALERMQ